jgi:TRAP-type C4-dicarboxylate transport system substrate-binding protein
MKRIGIALVALALPLAGCHTSPTDKAGSSTVVLRFAALDGAVNPTGQEYGQQAFVNALHDVSKGKIRAEVNFDYANGVNDPEASLVRAIAAGKVDGGWPATRAFAAAGIPGLQAIEAPFALTSYGAVREALRGAAGDQALAALRGTGIHGLGLTIAGLRRPFSSQPMQSPDPWAGLRMKTLNSPVQDATVTALGGVPVHTGLNWRDQLAAGTLKLAGAELALPIAASSGIPFTYYPTNLVLWPKVAVLSINENRFKNLTPEQQGWIEASAKIAEDASANGRYNEGEFVQALCQSGIRPYTVPDAVLSAMHERVQSVLDGLARDPAEAKLLRSVLVVAAAHPEPDAATQGATCQVGGSQTVTEAVPPIPDGQYRAAVTTNDLAAAHVGNSGDFTGTWTITIRHGTYAYTCSPSSDPGADCGGSGAGADWILEAGHLRGDNHVVRFVYDRAVHDRLAHCGACQPVPTKTVGWRRKGDQLSFFDVGQPVGDMLLVIKPWTKVS